MKKFIPLILAFTFFSGLGYGSTRTGFSQTHSSIKKWLQPKLSAPLHEGDRYFEQGNYTEAKRFYQQHLECHRHDSDAWHQLALSHLATGAAAEASIAIHSAIAIHPHSKYQITLARLQIYFGKILSARKNLTSIVSEEPKQPTAWLLLGNCNETMGSLQQAKTCYQKALDLDPNCHDAEMKLLMLERKERGETAPELKNDVVANSAPDVPRSRLLNEPFTLQTANPAGLCSLIESYHVSEDAPHPGLVPSEIIVWEPNTANQQDGRTAGTKKDYTYEKYPSLLPNPNTALKLEDL